MQIPIAYWQGMGMGAGLIVAIGAQNAFVLTCGIRKQHALPVAALCALFDALLIAAGVAGMGSLVLYNKTLLTAVTFGGAAFLVWFGWKSLRTAFDNEVLLAQSEENFACLPLKAALNTTIAVSLLNPHVYLDTVVMLGGISAHYEGLTRYYFGAGAATASILWFFALAFAGRSLAPLFANPRSWKILHVAVCLVVWWIAGSLLYGFFTPASAAAFTATLAR